MSGPVVVVATVGLIALSAFFVIIEFSLLGARSQRLEADAATSRSARAALKSVNELTLLLAAAQLGITACTFALGAVTKPAVDAWLAPVLAAWGVPAGVAGTASFLVSLLVVTFLHLVVGEMAPKSWAIAHPETSARATALPARAFLMATRPLLVWVNRVANRLVAASGVTPVDRAAAGGHDAGTLRQLVDHSTSVGTLDPRFHAQLAGVLDLPRTTVSDLLADGGAPTVLPADASVTDVQTQVARSEHLRSLVESPDGGAPRVVHVRDTLLEPPQRNAAELSREAFVLSGDTELHLALPRLRQAGEQIAAVMEDGRFVGVVTLADVVRTVMPSAQERTEPGAPGQSVAGGPGDAETGAPGDVEKDAQPRGEQR